MLRYTAGMSLMFKYQNLDGRSIKSHAAAVDGLKMDKQVIHPVFLKQIRQEPRRHCFHLEMGVARAGGVCYEISASCQVLRSGCDENPLSFYIRDVVRSLGYRGKEYRYRKSLLGLELAHPSKPSGETSFSSKTANYALEESRPSR